MDKWVLAFSMACVVILLWFLIVVSSITTTEEITKRNNQILIELSSMRSIIDDHNKVASEVMTKCVYYCVDSYSKNDQLNGIFWEVCYEPSVENLLYHQWNCTKTCSGGF